MYCFGDLADAGTPNGPVVLDSKGCHLRRHGGAWRQSTWFQFTYKVSGGYPSDVVTREPKTGTRYGTAIYGGIEGCDPYCGTVWQTEEP